MKPRLDISKVSRVRRELYERPKIIFAKLALRPEAYPDLKGGFASINTNCVHTPTEGHDLRTLTAILNSKLMAFVYSELFAGLKMGGGYFQFQAPQLRILPIKKPGEAQADKIVELVSRFIELEMELKGTSPASDKHKTVEGEISKIDALVDKAVYELYELDLDDVAKVEKALGS